MLRWMRWTIAGVKYWDAILSAPWVFTWLCSPLHKRLNNGTVSGMLGAKVHGFLRNISSWLRLMDFSPNWHPWKLILLKFIFFRSLWTRRRFQYVQLVGHSRIMGMGPTLWHNRSKFRHSLENKTLWANNLLAQAGFLLLIPSLNQHPPVRKRYKDSKVLYG